MEVEFDVKITLRELYTYLLYKSYTDVVGIFETVAGVVLLICFIIYGGYLYFFAGLVVLLYLPLSLYTKAARQLLNETTDVHYKINEEGIFSDDKEASKLITWQEILSVKAMGYSILLITKKETVILPKKDMEDVFDHFIKLLNQHVSGQRMKLGQKNI